LTFFFRESATNFWHVEHTSGYQKLYQNLHRLSSYTAGRHRPGLLAVSSRKEHIVL